MCVEERQDTPSQTCLAEASPVGEGKRSGGGQTGQKPASKKEGVSDGKIKKKVKRFKHSHTWQPRDKD